MHETIRGSGHEHVTATHDSTLEVTTDDFLTPAGDCIVGIEANRAPADLDDAFVEACRDRDATIVAVLAVDADPGDPKFRERIIGAGHPGLTFDADRDAVIRTSDHVDDRTIMINADRAAADIDRELVAALADGAALRLELQVD